MKHTPGPWSIRELTGEDHRGMGWIQDAHGVDVTCYGAQERWTEENRANAKLIAAAPELLLGAQRAYNYMLNTQRELGIADNSEQEFETVKLLRAAIAKATE